MVSKHDKKIMDMVENSEISFREAIAELDALVITHDQLYEYMLENGYSLDFVKEPLCNNKKITQKILKNIT